ncbi:MAG: glycosyltransferase family 39 protein [Kiritimatiellales bacterium]|nr:glycosyltransferase family 39 protein [Kiritimatiellales bacterium]
MHSWIRKIRIEIFALPALLTGIGLILFATYSHGCGFSPDSISYMSIAHNLIDGKGFTSITYDGNIFTPLTVFPPAYPVVLAITSFLLKIDIQEATPWISIILISFSIIISAKILYKLTNSIKAIFAGTFLLLFCPHFLVVHLFALSEPLYFFSMFLTFLLMTYYLEDTKRTYLLIAIGCTTTLAMLTRYIGIALLGACCITLLWNQRRSLIQSIPKILTFCIFTSIPLLLWFIRNVIISGTIANRSIGFNLENTRSVIEAIGASVYTLIVPEIIHPAARAILFILIIIGILPCNYKLFASKWRSSKKRDTSSLTFLLITFALLHFALVVLIHLSLNKISLNEANRLLAPSYIVFILLFVKEFTLFCKSAPGIYCLISKIIFTAILCGYIFASCVWVTQIHNNGAGFSAKAWRESPTMLFISNLSNSIPIYSNAPEAIYFLTGRITNHIPQKENSLKNIPNDNYLNEVSDMEKALISQQGIVVFFNNVDWKYYLPSRAELKEPLSLQLIKSTEDGEVYAKDTNQQYN